MSATCPSCASKVDPDSLNPVAQTGFCNNCGQVTPCVEPPGGHLADWVFDWQRADGAPCLVAVRRIQFRSSLFFAFAVLATFAVAVGAAGAWFLLLGWIVALAALLARRPSTLRLNRQRFEWKTGAMAGSRGSLTDDLVGFRVEKRRASETGVEYWTLAAQIAGHQSLELSSAGSRPDVQRLCDWLNEALFLMKAPPKVGPYR
jgi:hypothetical protein